MPTPGATHTRRSAATELVGAVVSETPRGGVRGGGKGFFWGSRSIRVPSPTSSRGGAAPRVGGTRRPSGSPYG